MPPRSSPSEGFRGFLKHCNGRVKKVFRSKDQAPAPSAPSLQSQPQPPPGASVSQPTPTQEPPPRPPARPQQPALLPQPVPIAGVSTSAANPVAAGNAQSANAEPTFTQATKKIGADAWSGLKTALKSVENSLDVFPPLKSALAGFLDVVDIFETAAQNRKDYAELGSSLKDIIEEFNQHPGEHTSSRFSEALKAMKEDLEKEMEQALEQLQRSGFRRHLEAGQGAVDVQECRRRVDTLCRELQSKVLAEVWRNQKEQQVDARLDKLKAALKAMYDSSLSDVVGRRGCTPGTREAILAGMRKWADNADGPKVYWLNGMAGTGKTTLAYSFCAEMRGAGRLGASFFCSRADAKSRDVSNIVPTIAHQLARVLPSYREALIRQMGEDAEIGARRIETQFEQLIRIPLSQVQTLVPTGILVVIDALDECERRDGAQDILNALLLHARDLPIKFFVTCRPEPGLFNVLQPLSGQRRTALDLHDIEASFVKADIRTYLDDELGTISLSQEKLGQLAEQAGTLFIYAATAVRYIHPKSLLVDFHQRLDDLLSLTSEPEPDKHKGIDKLYAAVLAAPFANEDLGSREKNNIRLILDTVLCVREAMNITTMAKLLKLKEGEVICALQHLRSVLHISQGGSLISTLHASFPDFMLEQDRSKDLHCNAASHHRHLSLRCFITMQELLRFNICELESSFLLDEKVPDLGNRIVKTIPSELFYACRYWGDHVKFAEALGDVHSALEEFLSHRLLFWMEVMNLKNCISTGASMLAEIQGWLQGSGRANHVLELAFDAGRFVTAFGMSAASGSTPHIYISALPFWPKTRPVRERYWQKTQGLTRLAGSAIEQRDLSCLGRWSAAGWVHCVAFSPDSTRIVSGSEDRTIRVWDAHSGALVAGPFKGHTESVRSVGFSPDGTRIVSGSFDTTIRVWDAGSGDLVAGPFEGHTSSVLSVGFSPDGTRIVSGSSDSTIRVWDAHSGALVAEPFEGHTSSVRSVGFSPDGTRIVSGSHDTTIRVWDAGSGDLVAGPFGGHTESVLSVGFSPDGTRIVSGSFDRTIRVWDAGSGDLVAGPFEGHTGAVLSVGFSPDGTRIVSGSNDRTIRVWDAGSGDLVAGPFEGHTSSVLSVGFSPDGTLIVSGSLNSTTRVWDAGSGVLVAGPFEGHTQSVESVGFSPDGTRIVSGSGDSTIRVWDAGSGDLVAGPFKGHTGSVSAVAFSPDGTCIVSCSDDRTIGVWNAHSGDLIAGPFQGHTRSVTSVGFSPDGTRIVSGSEDCTIRVWDARSGDLVAGPFEGHTHWVQSVGFSPDITRIVSGSRDKTIRVWDAGSRDLVAGPSEGHTQPVQSVGFSHDGTRIVSGSWDSTLRVWDTGSGDLVAGPFQGHNWSVQSVGFEADGTRIVSGSHDGTIRVWDARSGDLVAGPFHGHTDAVESVGFSPDGTRIVSGSEDNTIRVWDARSGDLVAGPFEGHTRSVQSVGFSPDGTHIVSGSWDSTIRVWEVTPHHTPHLETFTDWQMDEDGTLTTQQEQILLYVSRDLWTGLMRPHNTVCIYTKGALELDFSGALMGTDWARCYQLQ